MEAARARVCVPRAPGRHLSEREGAWGEKRRTADLLNDLELDSLQSSKGGNGFSAEAPSPSGGCVGISQSWQDPVGQKPLCDTLVEIVADTARHLLGGGGWHGGWCKMLSARGKWNKPRPAARG